MPIYITIAAAIAIAVTAKLMYLMFLSGKTITNATLFGRFLSRIEPARRAFVTGWRTQNWRYLLIAYPSMIATMGLVSVLLYWLMPALDKTDTLADKLRYCLLVFAAGVSASLTLSLVLILLIYFVISLISGWWNAESGEKNGKEPTPAAPVEASASLAEQNAEKGNGVTPSAPSPDR